MKKNETKKVSFEKNRLLEWKKFFKKISMVQIKKEDQNPNIDRLSKQLYPQNRFIGETTF